MATPIVEFHHDSKNGGFFTTSLFWDCECEERFIHDFTTRECPACGVRSEDAPDARVDEVLRNVQDFRLNALLVRGIEKQLELDALPY